MKSLLLITLCLIFAGTLLAADQPASLTPTEAQAMRLQLAQKDAIIAQQQFQLLQVQIAQAKQVAEDSVKQLAAVGEAVKKENKWPADTAFDMQKLAFSPPAPAGK